MAKDKILGVVLLVLGSFIAIAYTCMGPLDLIFSIKTIDVFWQKIPGFSWTWALMIPMYIVVLLICVVLIWLGYSMITTPPPVPLEELEEELEREEEASK